jgi:cytidylate kinase
MIIAIDGPVACGKSTAARNLAKALGFDHLDTGAIFRALTVLAMRGGTDASDAAAVKRLLKKADVRLEGDRVYLNGQDVSSDIRRPEVSSSVKPLAENPDVRDFVKRIDHRFASGRNIVAEGRDMGTVVFPNAEVKIYLTASPEERARRRWEELQARGTPQEYADVLTDLAARDHADMTRSIAPLRKAPDAVEVDTTGLAPDQSAERLVEIVRQRLKGR